MLHCFNMRFYPIQCYIFESGGKMQYEKGKLFFTFIDGVKHITDIPYNPETEYYTFLKKCFDSGYRQIIITSSIMLQIIEQYIFSRKFDIMKIEFMEDDDDLNNIVEQYLKNVQVDRAYYQKLLENLKFLCEKSSIEIKRVYFKGKLDSGDYTNVFIQVNGIIGINRAQYQEEIAALSQQIERCLL